MPDDFYDLLEVDKDASHEEINDSFRRLAKKYHPDASDAKKASEKFKTVQVARDILIDEDMREEYDQLGHSDFSDSYIEEELEGFTFTEKSKPSTEKQTATNSNTSTRKKRKNKSRESPKKTKSNRRNSGSNSRSNSHSKKKSKKKQSNRRKKKKSKTSGTSKNSSSDSTSSKTTRKKKVKRSQNIKKEYKSDIAESIRDNIDVGDPTTSSTESLVFKPRINKKMVSMVGFVILSFFMYIGSYAALIITQHDVNGVTGILEFTANEITHLWVINSVLTVEQLFGPLFIGCLVLITLSISLTVYTYGSGSTWLYPPVTLIPAVILLYVQFVDSITPFILIIALFIIPLVVVSVFVFDVLGALTKQYVKYYWAQIRG